MGLLHWMYDVRNKREMYRANLIKKRPKWRSKARWKDDVQNGIRNVGVVNWRQVEQDGNGWKREN